ncbi:MAG: YcjF family protein [Beijerinckiaceae bacterium]
MSRAPQAFDVPAAGADAAMKTPQVTVIAQPDPFSEEAVHERVPVPVAGAKKRSKLLPFSLSMLGGFLLLAFGNWAWRVVAELAAQNVWLGYVGLAFLLLALFAGLVWVARELLAIRHIARIEALRARALEAHEARDNAAAKAAVHDLLSLYAKDMTQARGRAVVEASMNDIIDADDRLAIAERTLLRPLDDRARTIIGESAKRVSVVTAVSPRALIDILFVGAETLRLVRRLAMLYGGRPGFFGSMRLLRAVFAQFLVTGGLAIGDDIAGQFLGHGVAARLSAKLGEGVLNGLLTARVGLAAIDACRPLVFVAEPRPKVREVAGSLLENIGKNPLA